MQVKLSSLRADLAKERDGDWVDAPGIPGVSLLVRSTNYPPFVIARDRAEMKLAQKYGATPSAAEDLERLDEQNAIDGSLAVEHLLLGWRGFDEEFSAERAAEILGDESYRALRNSVYRAARRVGRREIEVVEQAAKN